MKIRTVSTSLNLKKYLNQLEVDNGGIKILSAKGELIFIEIKDLHVGAANILKQDSISVGADLAVPKGTVIAKTPKVDTLLIGNKRNLEKLYKKILKQPFGLVEVARYIKKAINITYQKPKIMGIINANDDSFYSKSRFVGVNAIDKINKMIEEGADIIDIGGVSSRPGAKKVLASQEMNRLVPLVDEIYRNKLYERVDFSIDSYTPEVIKYVLDRGFCIVNDITGFQDDEICKITASYKATAVIMHMQGNPQTMQKNPIYKDVVEDIYNFLEIQLEKTKSFGIEDIILDVGIGFGKTLKDNIKLIQSLKHFKTLGHPLLIGASRKSLIGDIFSSSIEERLAGTLAIHLKAIDEGVQIVRVHDIYEHKQAIEIWQNL